ncbi:MAG: nitroreductase family protein [Anaerolineales bacterium]
MDVVDAIRTKRAVREYSAEPLPDDVVLQVLNAGRRAQSSKNTQPWTFVVVRDRARLADLARLGTYAGHLAGAAMAVVLVSPDPAPRPTILFDLGQAAAYMQLAAWELGVGSCLASVYEPDKAAELLGLPPDRQARLALSFGRPADPSLLHGAPRRGGRRPLAETVHWERWGSAQAPAPD